MSDRVRNITALLHQARDGDRSAFDDLFPQVYDELRHIAHQRLLKHRPSETLNTTALVHEAYLKLVDQSSVSWNDRSHFFALASRAMRFILVDYARSKTAAKRGGDGQDIPLSKIQIGVKERALELLDLDDALTTLASHDERLGQMVEYKFFGGLTHEEIAEVTGLSVPTVKRDWRRARTWLLRFMARR